MTIESASYSYATLVTGRALVGLGVGFGLAIDPVYISEISTAAHRGQLVTWSEIAINIGIVLGFASGLFTSKVKEDVAWRIMFAAGVILPCFVIFLSVSESEKTLSE
jgi:MFS family permease